MTTDSSDMQNSDNANGGPTMENTMKKRWYVIDAGESCTSYSAKKDASEYFLSERAAIARASELANSEPGKAFFVCPATRVAMAKIVSATVAYVK